MKDTASLDTPPLPKEETEALNRHGVFFKNRVLQELESVKE
jgi:hypothetical protein